MPREQRERGFILLTALLVLLLLASVLALGWSRLNFEAHQLRAQEDRLRLLSVTESALAEAVADLAAGRAAERRDSPLIDGLVTVEITSPTPSVRLVRAEGRRGSQRQGLELELRVAGRSAPRVIHWRRLPGS